MEEQRWAVQEQLLLKITTERALRNAMITHVLKGHGMQRKGDIADLYWCLWE